MKNDISKIEERIKRLTQRKKALEKKTTEQSRKRRNHLLISISSLLLEGKTSIENLEAVSAWITKENEAARKIRQFIFSSACPGSKKAEGGAEVNGNDNGETEKKSSISS